MSLSTDLNPSASPHIARSVAASHSSRTHLSPNAMTLTPTAQLSALLTIIRDERTARGDFIFYSDRIIRLLVEEGLNHLPVVETTVQTPTGQDYRGVGFEGKICGVSIMRAGEAMEQGLRECCRSVRIGKILIQRVTNSTSFLKGNAKVSSPYPLLFCKSAHKDEETALPKLFYAKLPDDIANRWVLLLDPMLATGGSAIRAAEVLIEHGVPEERIIFLNLVASPEGISNFCERFKKASVITAWIDEGLNDKKYIVPGLGDFGDRYFTSS